MNKTIEEAARQFTDELFAGDDLTDFDTQTEKNDAYVLCMAFGNHLMEQPLAERLIEAERRKIKNLYNMAKDYSTGDDKSDRVWGVQRMALLERIFGADFFKEET